MVNLETALSDPRFRRIQQSFSRKDVAYEFAFKITQTLEGGRAETALFNHERTQEGPKAPSSFEYFEPFVVKGVCGILLIATGYHTLYQNFWILLILGFGTCAPK